MHPTADLDTLVTEVGALADLDLLGRGRRLLENDLLAILESLLFVSSLGLVLCGLLARLLFLLECSGVELANLLGSGGRDGGVAVGVNAVLTGFSIGLLDKDRSVLALGKESG